MSVQGLRQRFSSKSRGPKVKRVKTCQDAGMSDASREAVFVAFEAEFSRNG